MNTHTYTSPFIGLKPYNSSDQHLFIGREDSIRTIIEILKKDKILFILGGNGAGKTSVVNAGVYPQLKSAIPNLILADFKPGFDPLNSLRNALSLSLNISLDSLNPFMEGKIPFYNFLTSTFKLQTSNLQNQPLLIFVDQFEDIYNYHTNFNGSELSSNAFDFLSLLLNIYESSKEHNLPIYLISTLDSDYISHCSLIGKLAEFIRENHYVLPRLKRNEIQWIVNKLLSEREIKMSDLLLNRILDDLKYFIEVLPPLQFCMFKMCSMTLPNNKTIDLIHYAKAGGISKVELPEKDHPEFKNWFLEMNDLKCTLYEKTGITHIINIVLSELYLEAPSWYNKQIEIYNSAQQDPIKKLHRLTEEKIHEIIKISFLSLSKKTEGRLISCSSQLKHIAELINDPEVSYKNVAIVLSIFRKNGNNFLSPVIPEQIACTDFSLMNPYQQPDSSIELSHTLIIEYWEKLKTWVKEESQNTQIYFDLENKFYPWYRGGKKKENLLDPVNYTFFKQWFSQCNPSPTWVKNCLLEKGDKVNTTIDVMGKEISISELVKDTQKSSNGDVISKIAETRVKQIRNFIELSHTHNRFKTILTNSYLVIISIFFIIAILAFFNANKQNRKAQRAGKISKSNELAYLSFITLSKDPTTAFRIAESSYSAFPGNYASQALISSYTQPPYYKLLKAHSTIVKIVKYSSDGKFFVSASHDKTVRIWNKDGKAIKTLNGHNDVINSVQISNDSKYILTSSNDKTARLWEVNGKINIMLSDHQDIVYNATFSPDNEMILTSCGDSAARLWNLKGALIKKLNGHKGKVLTAQFSGDNNKVITGSDDNTARIWDINTEKFIELKGHKAAINSVLVSPGSQYLLTLSNDRSARLWDLTGKLIYEFKEQDGLINTGTFSSNDNFIVLSLNDFSFSIWQLNSIIPSIKPSTSPHLIKQLKAHEAPIFNISFSSDGKYFLTASQDNSAKLWSVDGELLQVLKANDFFYTAEFSPDMNFVLSAHNNGSLRLWDIRSMENMILNGHTQNVWQAVFSKDGKYILTSSWDNTAILWSANGHHLKTLVGHTGIIYGGVFSPDNKFMVTGSADHTARVWDMNGNCIQVLEGHTGSVYQPELSPDGKTIATPSDDNTVRLWKLTESSSALPTSPTPPLSLSPYKILRAHTSRIRVVKFSPDGKNILCGSRDNSASLWDSQGNFIIVLKGHSAEVYDVCFSNDNKFMATASNDSTCRMYDKNGVFLQIFKGHKDGINNIKFSPDSRYLASGSVDNTAIIWNMSGTPVCVLRGHTLMINSIDFSPDGNLLLTSSDDMTARVWSLRGDELFALKGHTAGVQSACFSPDGNYILTASQDLTARIWLVNVPEILNRVNKIKTRGDFWNFSAYDRIVYGIDED